MASDPITDAAREAASAFLKTWEVGFSGVPDRRVCQAFATFAAAAVAEERARVFEQAARIAGNHPSFGPRDDFNRGVGRGRENAAAAIRAIATKDIS